ncbi:hypothetical protein AWZ03_014154 [Drosophila navojoa]|uniref:MADF domain-containing protein n=1 Tax=Drosophila navojoa TaxID=7232 RepID=A0A484ASN9_DRONA|nr:uncharacterized protein LOC115565172 [Drosophila navojoa]TDG39424.1 hypothetical protein AWZ03_014154 [Drosophila navojoa]
MEARRLERQRRDSAKSTAAEKLPSTQDEEFHLRLIDLYSKYPCLWKTTISDYENAALKRQAWQEISNQLGAHLSPSLVRSRISSMRYRLNLYKLQMIEYKMSPASGKKPEKLYYIDRFAFLDEPSGSQPLNENAQSEVDLGQDKKKLKSQKSSIANIFKQRMQQEQEQPVQLPTVLQRLSQSDRSSGGVKEQPESTLDDYSDFSIASIVRHPGPHQSLLAKNRRRVSQDIRLSELRKQVVGDQLVGATAKPAALSPPPHSDIDNMLKKRMHRLGMAEMGKESPADSLDSFTDYRSSLINIPSVVKKRMRQQLQIGMMRAWDDDRSNTNKPDSQMSLPQTSVPLRALPGDSVSKTKVSKHQRTPRPVASSAEQLSDEEDFYRLHWSLRQQQRSRRSGGKSSLNRDQLPQPVPPLLLGSCTTSSSNMESVHEHLL